MYLARVFQAFQDLLVVVFNFFFLIIYAIFIVALVISASTVEFMFIMPDNVKYSDVYFRGGIFSGVFLMIYYFIRAGEIADLSVLDIGWFGAYFVAIIILLALSAGGIFFTMMYYEDKIIDWMADTKEKIVKSDEIDATEVIDKAETSEQLDEAENLE